MPFFAEKYKPLIVACFRDSGFGASYIDMNFWGQITEKNISHLNAS
jgi:hypothetical protein